MSSLKKFFDKYFCLPFPSLEIASFIRGFVLKLSKDANWDSLFDTGAMTINTHLGRPLHRDNLFTSENKSSYGSNIGPLPQPRRLYT